MSDDAIPVVLTIAGTDPSGGAGINVDLQVFRDRGCHGTSAITAVVWQNTQGIDGWRAMPPRAVEAQLASVGDDISLDAVKIGMLPDGDVIREVGDFIESVDGAVPVVLDPVMAGGTGDRALMVAGGRRQLGQLSDRVDLITPNAPEARAMIPGADGEMPPQTLVEQLAERNWRRVLLKGGHFDCGAEVVDWYGTADGVVELEGLQAVDADVRGTGCQLSSAIAAELAHGTDYREAVGVARRYLNEMLRTRARRIGAGRPVVVRTEERE